MSKANEKHEIIVHEWTTLKTLWDSCKHRVKDDEVKKEIHELLNKAHWSSDAAAWNDLNRAEQVISTYLPAARLKVEYEVLLHIARSRSLASLPTFEGYAKDLFGSSASAAGASLEGQRAAYLALLYALQSGFSEARFERQLRGRTAIRLSIYGLAIFLTVLILHLARMVSVGPSALPLVTVVAVGALGAFFSRIMAFQSKFSSLRYEDITNNYRRHIFFLRILCGAIGALTFFFLLRSGLVEGAMFPNWSLLEPSADGTQPVGRAAASEWSKLVVWSFVAGFSERLVPDTLDRIQSR